MRRTTLPKLWLAAAALTALCLSLLISPFELVAQAPPANPGDVVFNEVAWGGTAASAADEWIELYNTTAQPIDLANWSLVAVDGAPAINLSGLIPPGGYFLLERTDDNAVSDIPADLTYTGALGNGGETLQLFDTGGILIDTANLNGGPWPAGSGSPGYYSMERLDPLAPDSAANWASNNGVTRNGLDANGNPIDGTPGQSNSTISATPTSTLSPSATAAPTLTPSPTDTTTPTLNPSPTVTAMPTLTPSPTVTTTPIPTPSPTATPAPSPGDVVFNEVAWGGTAANPADEWIELYNNTNQPVTLTGWSLVAVDGVPAISLRGVVLPGGYFLLERTDDNTLSDITADLIYTGDLGNGGETLQLLDAGGVLIDTANLGGGPWPAGSSSPDYYSMERSESLLPDSPANWTSNSGVTRNGLDANGNPINGTPKQPNSTPIATPTLTPSPIAMATPTLTPSPTVTTTLTPTPSLTATPASAPRDVVFNEVAWGGTAANPADEWVELYNNTGQPITLTGWSLVALDGVPAISLSGAVLPGGYFLLERTDDNTLSDITADLIYTGDLGNGGETLQLLDAGGVLIDTANLGGGPWPAGSSSPDYYSMERSDSLLADSPANWASNSGVIRNGLDANGNPINGTPKQPNSTPIATPTLTPSPTVTTTLTPTPSLTATPASAPGDVVFNEVAWGGTAANPADEWVELYNNTGQPITLTGWSLVALDGVPIISLGGVIPPDDYLLLERTDDATVSDIPADLIFAGGLGNGGETLHLLDASGVLIDTANLGGGLWPAGSGGPDYYAMERIDSLLPDSPGNWASNSGVIRNGRDANGNPINGTPKQPNSTTFELTPTPSPTPPSATLPAVLISEFLYDGTTPTTSGDEFVEICNAEAAPVDLSGFKIGDEERSGGSESMYHLPDGRFLAPDECLVLAKNAAQYAVRFGFYPDFELVITGSSYTDTLAVPNLARYGSWGSGNWALADDGDELLVLDPADRLVDSVAYRNGDYAAVGVAPGAGAPEPDSLQRIWPIDADSMPADFVRKSPSPGTVTPIPAPPPISPPAADLPDAMHAYWGILHSHSSYSDGAGPPRLAFATARANGLHFLAIADHDGWLTGDEWADAGTQAAEASIPGEFVGLRGYEYTHPTDGHITVWNTSTFASRDDPLYDTLPEFYAWLAARPDALAEFNHPFSEGDFYDFAYEPAAAPQMCLLEVGNGSELYRQYYTFEGQWMRALIAGWRVAPANNSDTENAYWGADTAHRTGLVAPALTQTDLVEALRARRAFATEDSNLALTLRGGRTWMGSVISNSTTLTFTVNALDLDPVSEPITLTLYDRTLPVTSATFATPPTEWTLAVPGQPGHFYWARAVQADGDVAQTAPIWTEGTPLPEAVVINEIMPAPNSVDWDGDGSADYRDEWLELYNASHATVALGEWQVEDASGSAYTISWDTILPPDGHLVLYRRETGLALNNDSETMILRRPDGTIADSHHYGDGPGYDISLCRLPDGDGDWHSRCAPTPGGLNRALPAPHPAKLSIFEARHVPLGSWVKLRGRITVPPGVFSQQIAYIQDESAGIKVYLPKDHRLSAELGDRWEITGNLRLYYGELELKVSNRQDVHRLRSGDPVPPLPIGTGVMVEPYEGTLVLLDGWAVDFERGGHFWADDGTGWARVYLDRDAGITRPWLEVGQPLQAVGVVSQYIGQGSTTGGYRLMPRYPFDLVIQQPLAPPVEWPSLLPDTGSR